MILSFGSSSYCAAAEADSAAAVAADADANLICPDKPRAGGVTNCCPLLCCRKIKVGNDPPDTEISII